MRGVSCCQYGTAANVWIIHREVFADNSKARKHKRGIGVYTCALTLVDLATRFKLGYALKHTGHLENTLEEIRLEIYSIENRILKVGRLDNQFIT